MPAGRVGPLHQRPKVSFLETENKAVGERDRLRSTLDVLPCLGFINIGALKLRLYETHLSVWRNLVTQGRLAGEKVSRAF